MLSTKKIGSSSQTTHYFFERDDYYMNDSEYAEHKPKWFGNGAKALNLSGEVKKEDFNRLLEGYLPDGKQIGVKVNGEFKHRAGYDLTLSCPKSMSVLMGLGFESDSLREAKNKAVLKTIEYIQQDCAQSRYSLLGKVNYEKTNNLVVAIFQHEVSRELDPHYHDHLVVMNMTQRADGKWTALATQNKNEQIRDDCNGFHERIQKHAHHYGSVFRSYLAFEVKKLGFNLREKEGKVIWEIAEVPEDLMTQFSKRRPQILQYMQKFGFYGGKAASFATLETRKNKPIFDREEIISHWQEEAKGYGFNPEKIFSYIKDGADKILNTERINTIQENILLATKLLTENKTEFPLRAILDFVVNETGLDASPSEVLTEIDRLVKNDKLIPLSNCSEQLYTTPYIIKQEQEIISNVINGQYAILPILQKEKSEKILDKKYSYLTTEQVKTINGIIKCQDRYQLIDGTIGSGKSTILAPIADIAERNKQFCLVLKKNVQDAESFQDRYKHRAVTVAHYIRKMETEFTKNCPRYKQMPKVLLVDDAHRLDIREQNKISNLAEKSNARIIFFGDSKQSTNFGRGNPFEQLIHAGITKYSLKGNLRQTNLNKDATLAALEFDIKTALEKIGNKLIETGDEVTAIEKIAKQKLQLDISKTSHAVILPNNNLCKVFNEKYREILKAQDLISSVDYSVTTLERVIINARARYQMADTYQEGQFVNFARTYESIGVQAGKYYQVINVNKKENIVEISDGSDIIAWDPTKCGGKRQDCISIYQNSIKNLANNEKIKFTKSISGKNINAGQELIISSIASNKMTVLNNKGKKISLDLNNHQHLHFNYNYAFTIHSLAEKNVDTILCFQDDSSFTTNQRSFYQTIGSAKESVWIFTPDVKKYTKTLEKHHGNKNTALNNIIDKNELSNLKSTINIALASLKDEYVNPAPEKLAEKALNIALAHLGEREATYLNKHIVTQALRQSIGTTTPEHIFKAIEDKINASELFIAKNSNYEGHIVPLDAINAEKSLIEMSKTSQNSVLQLCTSREALSHIKSFARDAKNKFGADFSLRNEQIEAIKFFATSNDRIVILEGVPGAGKTTIVKAIEKIVAGKDYEIIGLAPTNSAAEQLRKQEIKAQTLKSYCIEINKQHEDGVFNANKNVVLIADESSMVSLDDMLSLTRATQNSNTRIFYVGNKLQLPSIERGKALEILEDAGIKTTYLTDNVRQKDPILKEGIQAMTKGEFAKALTKLDGSIVELTELRSIFDKNDELETLGRLDLMAEVFFARSEEELNNCIVITPKNEDRVQLNSIIRDELIKIGKLASNSAKVSILERADHTHALLTRASTYKNNDIVKFNVTSKTVGIEAGNYYKVEDIDTKHNIVYLKGKNNKTIFWQPQKFAASRSGKVEVYKKSERNIAEGDRIRWTKTDKSSGRFSMSECSVIKVNDTFAVVKNHGGKPHKIDFAKEKDSHWDYAYASTTYVAQGDTKKAAIFHEQSFLKNLTNQKNLLVGASRAQVELCIIVDDKEKYKNTILQNIGSKTSALEAMNYSIVKNDPNVKAKSIQENPLKTNSHKDPIYYPNLFEKITENAESIVETILGKPDKVSAGQLRYGSKQGSLIITLNGDKRGLWFDHQTGEGGNLLKLVETKAGMSKEDAKSYVARLLSLQQDKVDKIFKEKTIKHTIINNIDSAYQEKIKYAQQIAEKTILINNTVAEKYLRVHRKITGVIPEDFRFHPEFKSKANNMYLPALVVLSKDSNGKVKGGQAIFLDQITGNKADVKVKKESFGRIKGSAVSINAKANNGVSLITEGPETGLSIFSAMPNAKTHITLGLSNFKNIDLKILNKDIVFCLDNDNKKIEELKQVHQAAEHFINQGKRVWINMPQLSEDFKKIDYNDLLKMNNGIKQISNHINSSIPYENWKSSTPTSITLNKQLELKQAIKIQQTITPKQEVKEQIHRNPQIEKNIKEIEGTREV